MSFNPVWILNQKKSEKITVFDKVELRNLNQIASSILDVSKYKKMNFFVKNSVGESITLSVALIDNDGQANQLMLFDGEKYQATATDNTPNNMMMVIPKLDTAALFFLNTKHTWLNNLTSDKISFRLKANGSVPPTTGNVTVFFIGEPY